LTISNSIKIFHDSENIHNRYYVKNLFQQMQVFVPFGLIKIQGILIKLMMEKMFKTKNF